MKTIVTLEFDTPAEAAAFLSGNAQAAAYGATAANAPPPKGKPAPKAQSIAEVDAETEKAATQPTAGYTTEELTADHIKAQVMQLGAKKGKAAAKELMAQFKDAAGEPCERASTIEADDYARALDLIKEALATA